MEYDEDDVLTWYVWAHFGHLVTEFERRVIGADIANQKEAKGWLSLAQLLRERWGYDDPAVEEALAEGVEEFRHRVCVRILLERGGEVLINRCPGCDRIVRTPKARQCEWCGGDWHDPKAADRFAIE